MVPRKAASGSVVGSPASSRAQPSGIRSPRCFAARMLPRATLDSDRSTTIGARPGKGQAKAIGLVPNNACAPPQGAIAAGVLAKRSATSPASARRSTGWPAAPQWCERRIGATATPCIARHLGQSATASVERRIGEAMRRVDRQHGRPRARDDRRREAVDLAGLGLRRVGRHARQAVALEPVRLGGDESARNGARVARATCCTGPGRAQPDPPPRRASASAPRHAPARWRRTFSTVTQETRTFDSTVTPAICGVRTRLGQPAKIAAARRGQRLLLEHVEGGAAEAARPQRRDERWLVDDAAARGVDARPRPASCGRSPRDR